jgi:AraC-like DNA-binding protein
MLLSRGMSLKSVAAQVGLFPATRFSEAFERRFGVSPRLFRDMHAEL